MILRRPAAALVVAVAPAALVSPAHAEEEKTAFFNRMDQAAGQRIIHASGGASVGSLRSER